ncbi:hypothetical protein GZ77_20100 [Endozoicomonas montiporae]|uniref:Toluene tolerance protein n=2 Tax=Endozoicomonas montiporae TaxID=1027273 RepID=A0A081N2U5_9GAMM|nr:ABC transporter substrate-binding protein [Endozoicomonas montiporae]AMO58037.1 phospholipid transport system substrate-binding protein [Endozoicomonas montiporae CL-33]KEQ12768.1 hypothetical protein GZ77_20100 [Endozoicomonas montiporae]
MNKTILVSIRQLFFTAATLLLATNAMAAPQLQPPEIEVEKITRNLLDLYDKNEEKYRKDREGFVQEVDRMLSPVVAFDQIARYVMGKYTRRSPGQVDKFETTFKDSLLRFYSNALLALDDTSLTIESVDKTPEKQLKEYIAGDISRIPVKMSVRTSTRSVDIFYSMVHTDGRWKLRNITIDGINIAKQFQTQFADAVDRYGKVETVVANWAEIMQGKDIKAGK